MKRFKLTLAYEGTSFHGWQRQEGLPTVQQLLEDLFQDFLQEPVTVWGSGRTDAGVHAEGQVAHVDVDKDYTAFAIQGALNNRLKELPVSILHVEDVPADFHARFSATSRTYVYKILNRRAHPALERDRVWWVVPPLSVEAMREAAQFLVGHHDFTSFRDKDCQAASPLKTLDFLTLEKQGETILFTVKARSFLHHQVRNMVGTLKRVGEGAWEPLKVKEILEARDRRAAGVTAPACGLYLMKIDY
jgi:pseudouridylate synthase I